MLETSKLDAERDASIHEIEESESEELEKANKVVYLSKNLQKKN